MNRLLITIMIIVAVVAAVFFAGVFPSAMGITVVPSNPTFFQDKLLGFMEAKALAHDTSLSPEQQQESLGLLEYYLGILPGIAYGTPELQQRGDVLLETITEIVKVGIVYPDIVTEYANGDGSVILTVTESERLSFTINDIANFDCQGTTPSPMEEQIVQVRCVER